jgi:very-short-patch-repair endonuclease
LIVEADGSQHGDQSPDAYLARQRSVMLRLWNHDILRIRESVIDTILARVGRPW